MKITFVLFTLLLISCSSKEKKDKVDNQWNVLTEKTTPTKAKLSFEEAQDSLRKKLLKSKPNNNLKSSLLQELYIRGMVDQVGNKILFDLNFNLHGFDCGAPDCYSTNISFEIAAKEPIEFPDKINFELLEQGCGIENKNPTNGLFELVEVSTKYVNYYSKKQQSNLVILGEEKMLYYFPNTKPNTIKVRLLDQLFEQYNDEDPNAIVPYQSTTMTTNEYENFLVK